MSTSKFFIYFFIAFFLVSQIACRNGSNGTRTSSYHDYEEEEYNEYEQEEYDEYEEDDTIEDGTYTATVEYYNPDTGHSATYTLDVDVTDGTLEVIYFPNDGWLDDSHIYPEELDEDGYAFITDDRGREFNVYIDY